MPTSARRTSILATRRTSNPFQLSRMGSSRGENQSNCAEAELPKLRTQCYNSSMTTKLTDEQRKAVEACAGQPVLVADEATNKVYYLLNEEAFAHLRGLQSTRDDECRSKLRALIEEA